MKQEIQRQVQQFDVYLQEWNAAYEEYAKSVGLSFTSLSILNAIYETDQCTQKKLCQVCFLPKQTVNAVVTSFYKKGWVRLEEVPQDRRNKTIHFTELGLTEAERIIQRIRDSELTAMERLSAEERRTLLRAVERYVTCCKDLMKEK